MEVLAEQRQWPYADFVRAYDARLRGLRGRVPRYLTRGLREAKAWTTNKLQVADLELRAGAGDGNRTRALSLGITGLAGPDRVLTCANGCVCMAAWSLGLTAVDRGAPSYLARIWHSGNDYVG
jgi:hypothetical protein